jgi:predicted transcriptional regulator
MNTTTEELCKILEKYTKDIRQLELQFYSVKEEFEKADEWNKSIEEKVTLMHKAGLSEAAIEAALSVDLGIKPKRQRKALEPVEAGKPCTIENQVLGAMTREGATSTQIYKQAGINPGPETATCFRDLAKKGWIVNTTGAKGRGAQWAITEAGEKALEL